MCAAAFFPLFPAEAICYENQVERETLSLTHSVCVSNGAPLAKMHCAHWRFMQLNLHLMERRLAARESARRQKAP